MTTPTLIDWNWFFSSFSQCAAALIAIIGAFVISRLLGLSEKMNLIVSEFQNLQIQYFNICSLIRNIDFKWYTKNSVKYSSKIKKSIIGEHEKKDPNVLIEKIITENPDIYNIREAIGEGIIEMLDQNKSDIPVNREFVPSGTMDRLRNIKDKINELEIASKTLILKFKKNFTDLESLKDITTSLNATIIVLMVAFPITVIYPLHFMPVIENQHPTYTLNLKQIIESLTSLNLKTSMLISFLAIIDGLFLYFFFLTLSLKRKISKALLENTEDFRKTKMYSPYFSDEKKVVEE